MFPGRDRCTCAPWALRLHLGLRSVYPVEEQFYSGEVVAQILNCVSEQGKGTFECTAAVRHRQEYRELEHERKRRFLMAPDRVGIPRDPLTQIRGVGAAPARRAAGAVQPSAGKRSPKVSVEVRSAVEERIRIGKVLVQGESENEFYRV